MRVTSWSAPPNPLAPHPGMHSEAGAGLQAVRSGWAGVGRMLGRGWAASTKQGPSRAGRRHGQKQGEDGGRVSYLWDLSLAENTVASRL